MARIKTKKADMLISGPTEEVKKEKSKYTEQDFTDLALLTDGTVDQLKEEFFLYHTRKFMSSVVKVVTRYAVSDFELEKIFVDADKLNVGGVMLPHVYLSSARKIKNRNKLENVKLFSIVDFPFGESSFKSKITGVRDGARFGVSETTVMTASVLTGEQNKRLLKSESTKLGRRGKVGVALNATDLDFSAIERAVKIFNKTKLPFITFVFGDASLEEVKNKLEVISKAKCNKKICVLANVDSADSVTELKKLGVDRVFTPYADLIASAMIKRFKIEKVK